MARPQNPARRTELLEELIALTARLPLSHLTFRTIAAELDVSTYTLVYHFGTRQELIRTVLEEAMRRRIAALGGVDFQRFTRAEMTEALRAAFRDTLSPQHLGALRLQFEGAALEQFDPEIGQHVRNAYELWITEFARWLEFHDVPAHRALLLARLVSDASTGIQYLQCLRDTEGTGTGTGTGTGDSIAEYEEFLTGFMDLVFADEARNETQSKSV
ncbi:TetR/AcrR family transcriptional regulator [Leucobacter chromiireducens]|uniref:TetR/AcrR family transcriptional regulator n=1 Tax=Leucobacter chromiireducens TaxID=283877 RepID=UPI000F635DCC|nr:TetR/AcrR family transcriptional regulator [Leucobacter chromiireducens]